MPTEINGFVKNKFSGRVTTLSGRLVTDKIVLQVHDEITKETLMNNMICFDCDGYIPIGSAVRLVSPGYEGMRQKVVPCSFGDGPEFIVVRSDPNQVVVTPLPRMPAVPATPTAERSIMEDVRKILSENLSQIIFQFHFSEYQVGVSTRCKNCRRSDDGLVMDFERVRLDGAHHLSRFLRRSFMCCPTFREYERRQQRMRDNWHEYGKADAVMLMQGPIVSQRRDLSLRRREEKIVWRENQLCWIDRKLSDYNHLWIRPVVRGDLGPVVYVDVERQVMQKGEYLLLQPSDADRDRAIAAAQKALQTVAGPTAPHWDPYQ